jgi:hypothetical protein
MKPFSIFKPGKHTASDGATLDFSEETISGLVSSYDPSVHEAPIVVGHPRDNGPAYGWVKSLSFSDGELFAEPAQLDPSFAEMVEAGRFKKRSASFYLPDSPSNPTPGKLYLRHVGFLGAQAPAVKGLKELAFSEDEGVVEFSGAIDDVGFMRRLREFLLARFSKEDANQVVPDWMIEDAQNRMIEDRISDLALSVSADVPGVFANNFSESEPEDESMTDKANEVDFAEREAALAAREAALAIVEEKVRRDAISAEVDAMVNEGRVLPANRSRMADFMASLNESETVDFAEEKQTQLDAFRAILKDARPVIDFSERSKQTETKKGAVADYREATKQINEFIHEEKLKGRIVSPSAAAAQLFKKG